MINHVAVKRKVETSGLSYYTLISNHTLTNQWIQKPIRSPSRLVKYKVMIAHSASEYTILDPSNIHR